MSFQLFGNQSTSCLAGHTTVSLSDGIHFPEYKMAAFLPATHCVHDIWIWQLRKLGISSKHRDRAWWKYFIFNS